MSYFVCVEPKSSVIDDMEIFNPSVESYAENLIFSNISVNGEKVSDINSLIREIVFDNINSDGYSSGRGKIGKVTVIK